MFLSECLYNFKKLLIWKVLLENGLMLQASEWFHAYKEKKVIRNCISSIRVLEVLFYSVLHILCSCLGGWIVLNAIWYWWDHNSFPDKIHICSVHVHFLRISYLDKNTSLILNYYFSHTATKAFINLINIHNANLHVWFKDTMSEVFISSDSVLSKCYLLFQ